MLGPTDDRAVEHDGPCFSCIAMFIEPLIYRGRRVWRFSGPVIRNACKITGSNLMCLDSDEIIVHPDKARILLNYEQREAEYQCGKARSDPCKGRYWVRFALVSSKSSELY